MIISNILLIKKIKLLANRLEISEDTCVKYSLEWIYNINETGFFYQYIFFFYIFYLI